MKTRDLKAAAVAGLLFIGIQGVGYAQDVANYNDLYTAIHTGKTPINLTANIEYATKDLGGNSMGDDLGADTITINGNGFEISGRPQFGSNKYSGHIHVKAGQTFTINNVGSNLVLDADGNYQSGTGFHDFITDYYSGGIVYSNQGTTNLTDSIFYNNQGSYAGVFVNKNEAKITGSKFVNNSSEAAGVVFNDGGTLEVSGSEFTNNQGIGSLSSGGVIKNNGTLTVKETSKFTGNSSNEGGAIYTGKSDGTSSATIQNSEFSKNKSTNNANNGGGAIYAYKSSLNIENTTFTENESKNHGGALYVLGSGTGDQVITNGTFTSNKASKSGGAIYNFGNFNSITGKFESNTAATAGGAIYNGKDDSNMGNIASITANFISNQANAGGAIYNAANVVIENILPGTSDEKFSQNHATTSGGAIYNQGTINNIGNIAFESNTAASGAAIYNENSGEIKTLSGQYTSNVASSNGGALYNNGKISTSINSAAINSNTATNGNGGGIYNSGTITAIVDSNFSGNQAGQEGGAIYNSGTVAVKADSQDVEFATNSASKGGAIYNTNSLTLESAANHKIAFNNNSGTGSDLYQTNAGTTTIKGAGTVEFNGSVAGLGTINKTEAGEVVLGGDNSGYTGSYSQAAGTTTVNGTFFGGNSVITDGILNWFTTNDLVSGASLKVNGGSLVIGESVSQAAVLTLGSNSAVATGVATTINQASKIVVDGVSNLTLGSDDTWNGTVEVSSGKLTVDNVSSNGKLTATGGTVELKNGTLSIANDSSIAGAVTTLIDSGTILNISDGSVALDSGDTWAGKISLSDTGELNVNSVTSNGVIAATGGALKLNSGTLNIQGSESSIADAVALTLGNNSILNIKTDGVVNIDNANDTWNESAKVTLDGGTLNYGGTSNGVINVTSGDLNLLDNSVLTVKDLSTVDNATAIDIASSGSLVLQKNTEIKNAITGSGNVTVDNSKLTFKNNSSMADTIQFKSQNNSTVELISSTNANDILTSITNGTNAGLKLVLDNTNSTTDLNIDGTNIASLDLKNTVSYDANLINNGTVTNSGTLDLAGTMSGTGTFTNKNNATVNASATITQDGTFNNNGTLNLTGTMTGGGEISNSKNVNITTGDASGFSGTYTQTAGSTVVSADGKIFGGDKNINGGSLKITSAGAIDYDNVHLGNNAKFEHIATSDVQSEISSDVVDFTGSGATATFGTSDESVTGNFVLTEKIDNGQSNTLVVENSNLILGDTDFSGKTNYKLDNVNLDLGDAANSADCNDYTFSNLTTTDSTLSFNVKFVEGTDNNMVLETDTLNVQKGNASFNFGNIYISGTETGQSIMNTVNNVLQGTATFNGQPNPDNINTDGLLIGTGATTAWQYDVTATSDRKSIQIAVKEATDENTLYKMNDTKGNRFFQFSDDGTDTVQTYHIDQSLGQTQGQKDGKTGPAIFNVTGHDKDKNILSGELYDAGTHSASGGNGSFFDIAADTEVNLNISNLTIQDAAKTGNGSVVSNMSADAVVSIDNVVVKNNSATGDGGAIYNGVSPADPDAANLVISDTTFSGNSAGGNGGAIYNAGNMTLTNVTVEAGSDSAKNDIYQAATGKTVLSGTNTIASDISGSGAITNQGTLNTSGDNSQYTGVFAQTTGTTNVTGTFFGGNSTITGGTLNWFTENDIPSGTLKVNDGTLVIGKDANQEAHLTIGTGSSIASDADVTINNKSELNVGADVTLDSGDTWNGKVNVTDGTLTLNNATNNGIINATGGTVDITAGTLKAGTDSVIEEAAEVLIKENTNLNVDGGTVSLDSTDTWTGTGTVQLANGTLNLNDVQNNGKIATTGGTLNLDAGTLTVATGSTIGAGTTTNLDAGTTTDITGGTVNLNSTDDWTGDVLLNGGTLNYDLKSNGKLTATTGNLNLQNDSLLTLDTDSSIAKDVITSIAKDSTLKLDGTNAAATIDSGDTWNGKIEVATGTLTVDNATNNGIINATGGTVDIVAGTLKAGTDSVIAETAEVLIKENTNLNVDGGTVSLDSTDTWTGTGTVQLANGTLNLNDVQNNGKIATTGGTLNLDAGTLTVATGSTIGAGTTTNLDGGTTTDITGGTVNLNSTDDWAGEVLLNGGTLNYDLTSNGKLTATTGNLNLQNKSVLTLVADDSVAAEVKAVISKESTMKVNGGEATLNNNDKWNGTVEVTDGTLTVDNATNNGIIKATGGTVDITAGTLAAGKFSSITDDAVVKINDTTTLAVTGGDVSLGANDEWTGKLVLTDGKLTVSDLVSNSILQASGGELNVNSSTLEICNGGFIDGPTITNIKEDGIINITDGGLVQIDRNDNWKGEILLNGGTLNYNTDNNALLTANTGNLNLLPDSYFVVENGSKVDDVVNVDIQKSAVVDIKNAGTLNLDTNDKWNGLINISDGLLTTTKLTNQTGSGGGLRQTGGTSIFQDNSHIYITDKNSYINGGDVNILDNSSLYFGAHASHFIADNLRMADNSLLDISNQSIDKIVVNKDMIVDNRNDVKIDLSPRDWKNDSFSIENLKSDSTGTINIADFNFIGLCPIDRKIKYHIFDIKSNQNVSFDSVDKEIFTPIGWYDLKPSGGGWYTSSLTKYNPQVFRGQVATLAMHNNQLAIDDMLLNHVSLQSERFLAQGKNANKYAIADSMFAPYQHTKEDGGLWFKAYANFENLSMTQGLKVGNNSYGSIIGADFPVVHLKHGWEFMPTAYVAYNGSHQTFSHVGMYQNGGQGGFMGTFMKNDFIGSVLAYGGGYNNEMSVAGYTDHTGNWFAGTAAKVAYNLHASKHFTVQPTAFVSYNIFGRQNWGTDFGSMSMNSGLLNGVNVAPGVNFIYARETWNIYATIQYMYNINDKVAGTAGHVDLNHIRMRHGYLQYGLGVTKTWKDRMNSFFQITFRNGGRTGVGFQLGFQYLFDWFKKAPQKVDASKNNDKKSLVKSL